MAPCMFEVIIDKGVEFYVNERITDGWLYIGPNALSEMLWRSHMFIVSTTRQNDTTEKTHKVQD